MRYLYTFAILMIVMSFPMTSVAEGDKQDDNHSIETKQTDRQNRSRDHYDVLLSGEVLEWYEKALRRYHHKAYDDTIVYLNRVLERFPDFIPALRLRGLAYIAKGKISKSKLDSDTSGYDKHIFEFQQAVNAFSRIIELDPDNEKAYFYRGMSYRYLDYYPVLAIEDLDKYIDDFKHTTSEAYLERGVAYRQRGYLTESISDLEQAVRLNPDSVDSYVHLMQSYDVAPSYDLAEKFLETMTREHADKAHPWFYRGVANLQLGKHSDAELFFKRALSVYPDYDEAKKMLEIARRAS